MEDQHPRKQYLDQLNRYLPTVDFIELDRSCNSAEDGYAKEVLKSLHDIFVEVYGTDRLDSGYGFADVPAVVLGRGTGHIGLGIVTLDVSSSGEHYGTWFLTPLGVLDAGDPEMSPAARKHLRENYGPYDYWYTVRLEWDCHADLENIPAKVADLLSHRPPGQPELKME